MDSRENLKYWIALKRIEGLGNVGARNLLRFFPSPEQIFRASRGSLSAVPGIGKVISDNILSFSGWSQIQKELDRISHLGIRVVTCHDPLFPAILQNIYDAPVLFYLKGTLNPNDIAVALVGSRRASSYGKFITDKFARELSLQGIAIVSGMARGIDSSAHKGALAAGGRTIAVLGSGIDVIYPPENKELYFSIAENGAVISEYSLGTPPNAPNFPARNRIISGLSYGVVVVEASDKSGSLITARIALEQGREVFAVPGTIDSPGSRGTHRLIREGASLAESARDILSAILPQVGGSFADCRPEPAATPGEPPVVAGNEIKKNDPVEALSADETAVFNVLGDTAIHIDAIIQASCLKPAEVAHTLLSLEIQGLIRQMPGQMYTRKEGATCRTH